MNDVLDWILMTVQSVDPIVRALLAAFGILLETSLLIGLIVPGDTIVLVASTAAAIINARNLPAFNPTGRRKGHAVNARQRKCCNAVN